MKLVWLPAAIAARMEQIEYIEHDNPRAAIRQDEFIETQVQRLREYPELGRIGRMIGTRELVILHTPFIVIYRIRPRAKRIEVLQLLHSSQQWPPKKIHQYYR